MKFWNHFFHGFVLLQFVIVSLAGWGVLIFSGYKFFTGGEGKKDEVFHLLTLEHYVLLFLHMVWPRHQICKAIFHFWVV